MIRIWRTYTGVRVSSKKLKRNIQLCHKCYLIPMQALLTELTTLTCLTFGNTITHFTISTIFEDNKGCVELANAKKIRPCTKHIALKYHQFCYYNESSDIKIRRIDTKHQLADIFSKPLAEPLFASLRLLLLGWLICNQRECTATQKF